MDQRELQLVAPLVGVGALPRDGAEECLKLWQGLHKQGRPVSLLVVLVKKGLLTQTQARVLAEQPLEKHQPFPNYRLLRPVGEGGMAVVYEATYEPLQARVALKILKTEFALQERYRVRFKREAQLLLALDHPNLVDGREHATADGVDFYAMGFVDGINVLDLLEHPSAKDSVLITEGMALHIACQVGSALEHMRGKGVVHRDIKPANLVLDQDGTVRIIDFGLARVVQGMREDTAESMTVGTPEYMSPEQARGGDVDIRADIYSLGISLFHMITGGLPFTGTPEEIIVAQVKQDLEFTPAQMARISPPVQFVIRKAMAKQPDLRYATPQEMVDDIEAVAGPIIAARGAVPKVVTEATAEVAPIAEVAPLPGPVMPKLQSSRDRKRTGRDRPGGRSGSRRRGRR